MREIFVYENRDAVPDEWRVEDIDADGDGSVSVVIFSGFETDRRAKRYADRLRTNTD